MPNVHQSLASLAQMVFNTNQKEAILLPDFQRAFVWSPKQQAELIASFLIGVPLGALMLFEGRRDQYMAKKMGTFDDQVSLTPCDQKVLYLLDGQQRLTTLMSVFFDWFENKSPEEVHVMLKRSHRDKETLYEALHLRWFIDLRADMKDKDLNLFAAKGLEFKQERFFKDPHAERLEHSDVIISERINSSNTTAPFHPINYLNDPSDLIEYCVDRLRIPLFMLSNQWRPTLNQILSRIELRLAQEQNLSLEFEWAAEVAEYLNEGRVNDESYFLLEITPIDRIQRGFHSFAKRNSSGMDLKAFDLLTSRAAIKFYAMRVNENLELQAKSSNLQERILDVLRHQPQGPHAPQADDAELTLLAILHDRELTSRFKDVFSQLISVFSAFKRGEEIKPEHTKTAGIIAHTRPEDVYDHFTVVSQGLLQAARHCREHLGVSNIKKFAFRPIFLPIAYAFTVLKSLTPTQAKLLKAWYWATMFSLEYGKDSSTSAAYDCEDLVDLLRQQQLSSRLKDRTQEVFHYELFKYTPAMLHGLQMSGNNLENTSSQRKVISSFVLCQSKLEDVDVDLSRTLLAKRNGQNIFEHPLNATCAHSTLDQHLIAGVNRGDITHIRELYVKRSQQLIEMVRAELEPLQVIINASA